MFIVLVQFGGPDGLMQEFRGSDMNSIRNQIRFVAAVLSTPESEIQILCSNTPKETKP